MGALRAGAPSGAIDLDHWPAIEQYAAWALIEHASARERAIGLVLPPDAFTSAVMREVARSAILGRITPASARILRAQRFSMRRLAHGSRWESEPHAIGAIDALARAHETRMLPETLRWAADAIERGDDPRHAQREINRAFAQAGIRQHESGRATGEERGNE